MTTIKIGDTFNPTGAVSIPNFAPSTPFRAGYTGRSNVPVDLRATPMGSWTQGLFSGAFATYKPADAGNFNAGAYPQLCWLAGQECAYPNADADADLGGTMTTTLGSSGLVTMRPVLPNTGEVSAISATAALGTGFPAASTIKYLAGAICSAPYCLKPPLAFGFTIKLPADMSKGGKWPAGWLLTVPQVWPPEIDILEAIEQGTLIDLTSSNHDAALPNQSTTDAWATTGQPGQTLAMMGVVYPDLIAIFSNGVCVATFPTQSDQASAFWYLILNDGIGAPGSWAGSPPAGASLAPTTFSAITAYAMPAVYGGGVPSVTPRTLINQAQALLTQALTLVP